MPPSSKFLERHGFLKPFKKLTACVLSALKNTRLRPVLLNPIRHCYSFLTCELRACAIASWRYDVENDTRSLARSLDWSIPVNFFSILVF